jgi:methyl-accepting chemotaxis protein
MKNIIAFLTAPYSSGSKMLLRKAELLSWVVFFFGALCMVLTAVMALTRAVVVTCLCVVLLLLFVGVLVLIRGGRYSLATNIFLVAFFAVMFSAIKFDQYVSIYECYVYGTLGLFLLIVAGLVGNDARIIVALTALTLAEIPFLYVVDVLPQQGGQVTLLDAQSLATSLIMVILGGTCATILLRTQISLMEVTEKEAIAAAKRYEQTREAVLRAKDLILESGRGIAAGAERTAEAVARLEALASSTSEGVRVLDEALQDAFSVNDRSAKAQSRVQASLESYSKEVAAESSSVEQMAHSLDHLASASKEKKDSLSRLRSIAQETDTRLASLKTAISRISTSAARMKEMNVLISDVAEKTNMLGMNSSIEAAHLGAAGKGFAVIAGEIRGLSREAAAGSQTIAEMLGETARSIFDAEAASVESAAFFSNVMNEIDGISHVLEELLSGMQELSVGSSDLLASVTRVSGLTANTREVVEAAKAGLEGAGRSMAAVADRTKTIDEATSAMQTAFDLILDELKTVRNLGDRNIEHVENLRGDLERIGALA